MGLTTNLATLLVRARLQGVRFTHTITIGRLSLYIPGKDLKAMAHNLGIRNIDWSTFASDGFAEDFFRHFLGSESVQSIDYSNYQNVDISHDLNTPIPNALNGTFDALVDGGSLEHIFDVKQALANYMNMIRVNGCLFLLTNANNFCGHGFYQFSPEFFYRVLGNANGFVVNDALLIEHTLLNVELSRHQRCFHVVDPAEIGRRIILVNGKPVMIFIHATRVSNETPFREVPIQSDYRTKWQSTKAARHVDQVAMPFEYLSAWEEIRRRLRERKENSLANDRFFQPLKK